MSAIPARLDTLHTELAAVHAQLHADSNAAGQRDPHLREAVSAASAALAAVERARGHVRQAYRRHTANEDHVEGSSHA